MTGRQVSYKLKTSGTANVANIMVFHSDSLSVNDLSAPIKISKTLDNKTKEPESIGETLKSHNRKSTKILDSQKERENISLQTRFTLEDFDGQHTFHGKSEEGQTGKFIFLVNHVVNIFVFRLTNFVFYQLQNGSNSAR